MLNPAPDASIPTPNKRLKTLIPESSSSSKGKSTTENEESNQSCGICLFETTTNGSSLVRGFIDSCDHFFCFICIMEWSKVESRCPMCKRRFSSIRRPAKPPVFPSNRVIPVPVRDQVYHYFGNVSTGPPNPYLDVQCSQCHGKTDEHLLLLCDLCDTAAHTYCVGLGSEVPEGDWFCIDCTLLRDEKAKSEITSDASNETDIDNLDENRSIDLQPSISYIIRDCRFSGSENSTVTRDSSSTISLRRTASISSSYIRRETNTSQLKSKVDARTLSRCRNVHERIRALRENWNGFRSGSLSFSSSNVDPDTTAKVKPKIDSSSGKLNTAVSSSKLPVGGSSDALDKGINKAWKMLDIAKTIECNREKARALPVSSNYPLKKGHPLKKASEMNSRCFSSITNCVWSNDFPYTRPGNNATKSVGGSNVHPLENNDKTSQVSQKQEKLDRASFKRVLGGDEGSNSYALPVNWQMKNSELSTLLQLDDGSRKHGRLTTKDSLSGSSCLSSSIHQKPGDLNVPYAKVELHASSSTNSLTSDLKGKVGMSKNGYDAKSEIQSLVKLNLKLLDGDQKLDVHSFKEVAKIATHSIFAACGLERPKLGTCSFPPSACSHVVKGQQFRRSTLMPNSCRECFYLFVRHVVNTILLDRKERDRVSR